MTKMNGIKMKDAEKQSKMAQNLQTGSYLKNMLHKFSAFSDSKLYFVQESKQFT